MKAKLILFTLMTIFLCSFAHAYLSYQEYSNTSDNGNVTGGGGAIYLNYSKPPLALSTSLWQIAHGFNASSPRTDNASVYNISIPQGCWDYDEDILAFRVYTFKDGTGSTSAPYCLNDSGWWQVGHFYTNGTLEYSEIAQSFDAAIDGNWTSHVYYTGNTWKQMADPRVMDFVQFARVFEEAMWWDFGPDPIDDCSSYNVSALNVTFKNIDDDKIPVDTQLYIAYTSGSAYFNYSFSKTDVSNFSLCITNTTTTYYTDILISYQNGTSSFEYSTFNTSLSNVTKVWDLYVTSGASQVVITVTDYNGDPVSGAYIKVLKFDVGDGLYKTTEILRTDDDGQTVANLVLIDAWYKFIIEYDGIVRLVEPEKGGIRVLTTTKNFQIRIGAEAWYTNYDTATSTASSLTYDNTTDTFTFIWSDSTANMHYGCLRVIKRNQSQETLITDTCTYSTAGSISQAITPQNGSSFHATGYIKFDEPYVLEQLVQYFDDLFKFYKIGNENDVLYFGSMLMVGMVLLGLPFPILALILMSVSLVAVIFLGFFKMGLGLAVGIVLIAFLHWYKMRVT